MNEAVQHMEKITPGNTKSFVMLWGNRLKYFYKQIGRMQELSFYENNFKTKNIQFCRQESISVLENNEIEVHNL